MKLTARIKTPDGLVVLECEAHLTRSPAERLIEAAFYEEYCTSDTLPQGDHYELELTTPVWEYPTADRIHFHRNPASGRNFVCWAGTLSTILDAEKVFMNWCLGTAYTMVTGKDFVPLVQQGLDHLYQEAGKVGVEIMKE